MFKKMAALCLVLLLAVFLVAARNPGAWDTIRRMNLGDFAATTSAQLLAVLSDETGTGLSVFSIDPIFKALSGNALAITLEADASEDNNDSWQLEIEDGGDFNIKSFTSGAWVDKFSLTNAGVATLAGGISVPDGKGTLIGEEATSYQGATSGFRVATNVDARRVAVFTHYRADDTMGFILALAKSQSDTQGVLAYPGADSVLGDFVFAGADEDGARFEPGAKIRGVATELWDATGSGTKIEFYTTDDGTLTNDLRMTIGQDGAVDIVGNLTVNSIIAPTITTPKVTFQTVEKSADAAVLTAAEASDSLVTNRGWDGNDDQTITLPEADTSVGAGLKFKFLAVVASSSTADTYLDTEGSTTNIYLNGTAIGNGERVWTQEIAIGEGIICQTATIDGSTYDWFCDSINGTWADKGS